MLFHGYTVHKNGDVINPKGHKIKPKINEGGYSRIRYTLNKKSKDIGLHKLLATVYIENPNNYTLIDHIDRDVQNNNLSNLRWASSSLNGYNSKKKINNTSGCTGVYTQSKQGIEYYQSSLNYESKTYRKLFNKKDNSAYVKAVKWRLCKEIDVVGLGYINRINY